MMIKHPLTDQLIELTDKQQETLLARTEEYFQASNKSFPYIDESLLKASAFASAFQSMSYELLPKMPYKKMDSWVIRSPYGGANDAITEILQEARLPFLGIYYKEPTKFLHLRQHREHTPEKLALEQLEKDQLFLEMRAEEIKAEMIANQTKVQKQGQEWAHLNARLLMCRERIEKLKAADRT